MAPIQTTSWQKIPVKLKDLCIDTTLRCGQSFRWRQTANGIWFCTLRGRTIQLRQDEDYLHFCATRSGRTNYPPSPPPSAPPSEGDDSVEDDTAAFIKHYFNLEHNLQELYQSWGAADANFRKRALAFTGIRILRQDAWEALAGFICSSNNNIARISQMMEKLCLHYGPIVGHVDASPCHDFPSPLALAKSGVEEQLRQLGFGYRAKYLHQTAIILTKYRSPGWLDGLRNPEFPVFGKIAKPAGPMQETGREGYRHAHEQLLQLQGVGPKVADCVALMGLGWSEGIPVDTHVWQIAKKDYGFGKGKHASLTKATYDAIGSHFRKLWGPYAGWAHSVLFTADLKSFSDRISQTAETRVSVVKTENDTVGAVDVVEKKVSVQRKRIRKDPVLSDETTTELLATGRSSKRLKARNSKVTT